MTCVPMLSRRHILLMECSRDIQAVLTSFLEAKHCYLHCVSRVAEAIGLCGRQTLDAAIIDLSESSSVQAKLRMVRRWRDEDLRMVVIATSAQDYDGLSSETLEAGADDFLRKPYLVSDLFARLQRRLDRISTTHAPKRRVDGIELPIKPFVFAGATVLQDKQIAFPSGRIHKVSAKHIGILLEFDRHRGGLVLRDELIRNVWGADANTNSSSVHQYLHVLKKLYHTEGLNLSDFVVAESKAGWRIAEPHLEKAAL